MTRFELSHLTDAVLVRDLPAVGRNECNATAVLLAYVAEFDRRRLFLGQAQPSMHAYCMRVMNRSEGAADKLIRAARVARAFPAILSMVADGRLHLSGVVMLASRLTPENADQLLAGAARKSKSEIERLLAQRFPKPDLAARVAQVSPGSGGSVRREVSPGTPMSCGTVDREVSPGTPESGGIVDREVSPGTPETAFALVAPEPMLASAPHPPLAPKRFGIQFTIGQETREKLRRAQELASHTIRPGDLAQLFDAALDELITKLERRKCGATKRARSDVEAAKTRRSRHIPNRVKQQVWERDGGQCTFVSPSGQRCCERMHIEYDHIDPYALGGNHTPDRLRLRCRAHNQYTAERELGAAFMANRRQQAWAARIRKTDSSQT